MLKILSVKNNKLNKNHLRSIILLKKTFWKYSFKSHVDWLKKNVKEYDVHNLLFFKKLLVGYTLLRRRKYFCTKNKEKIYLYLDTFIIKKQFRDKNLAKKLMKFNNKIIKNKKLLGFLICEKYMIPFYKKNTWKLLSQKSFKVVDHHKILRGMVYNSKKIHDKYNFYLKK